MNKLNDWVFKTRIYLCLCAKVDVRFEKYGQSGILIINQNVLPLDVLGGAKMDKRSQQALLTKLHNQFHHTHSEIVYQM